MLQKLNQIRSSISAWIDERRSNHDTDQPETSDANPNASLAIFKRLTEKLKGLQNATGERANQLAESLAKQITTWTGKETTADDVKKGARNGAILGTIVAMFLVASKVTTNSSQSGTHSSDVGAYGKPGAGHYGTGSYGARSHGAGSHAYNDMHSQQQSEEEWLEQSRIEEDHLDHVRAEEQQQYFDQMQGFADDNIAYNDY